MQELTATRTAGQWTNSRAGGRRGEQRVTQSTRIVIADDHPLVRGALRQAVAGAIDGSAIVECGDLDELVKDLDANGDADLILLDLAMPGVRGFSGLMYLRAQHPGVPVVIVSGNEDRGVMRRCIDFGASGFIPKTTDIETMRAALRLVLDGGTWTPPDVDLKSPADKDTADIVRRLSSLTPQQVRVLMMLSEGLLNKQIAYELSVSEATVKAHVSAILQKLGVESRTQAVIAASKIEAGHWQGASPGA
jgi:DNA-binding NarL/FixJ family response regulator